jgi:ubiquinone/menaquinone biosynthesis C-methylase UbiE
MADPFQDVDSAGPEFVRMFADSMEARQADPTMEGIVADYLGKLVLTDDSKIIEVGAGAGAVSRRIAAHAFPATVVGYDPSQAFIAEARDRAKSVPNLSFVQANGGELPLDEQSVNVVIMHTS